MTQKEEKIIMDANKAYQQAAVIMQDCLTAWINTLEMAPITAHKLADRVLVDLLSSVRDLQLTKYDTDKALRIAGK